MWLRVLFEAVRPIDRAPVRAWRWFGATFSITPDIILNIPRNPFSVCRRRRRRQLAGPEYLKFFTSLRFNSRVHEYAGLLIATDQS